MAFTKLTDNLGIIASLDDQPNDVGGLSSSQLKAKFDEAPGKIKNYLNTTLTGELEGQDGARNIGIATIPGVTGATTVQSALEKIQSEIAGITQGSVADGSITNEKIADGAINADKLSIGCVHTQAIEESAITTGKLEDQSVTTGKLEDQSVTTGKLEDQSVTTGKLATGSVTHEKIANAAIGTENVDSVAITEDKIGAGAVTRTKIGAEAVDASKLAANSVSITYTATIGTAWSGTEAPFSQEVTITGLQASDNPIVDIVPSSTYDTAVNQIDAWCNIYRIVTAVNKITVYANSDTTVEIPIQLKVVRK